MLFILCSPILDPDGSVYFFAGQTIDPDTLYSLYTDGYDTFSAYWGTTTVTVYLASEEQGELHLTGTHVSHGIVFECTIMI